MKIYIEIGSGLVQNVYADAPADVEVIDMDTTDWDEKVERAATLDKIRKDPNLTRVW